MVNIRIEKLKSQLLNSASKIINNDVKNSNIDMITITKARLTNDLSILTLYINVLGNKEKTLEALNRTKGFIKSKLAQQVKIRKMPNIIFKYDDSLSKLNKIEKILSEIKDK